MPSLRPSQFNRVPREDGGPFLCIVKHPEYEQVDVYFSEVPDDEVTEDSKGARLLTITDSHLTMYPIHVRPDKTDYLQPKYDTVKMITITPWVKRGRFELPENQGDVEALLQELPEGFSKDFRFGLGLLWEYRSIFYTIADIPNIVGVVIHGGPTLIENEYYVLGLRDFVALRKEIKRITARHSRRSSIERHDLVYHRLLHDVAPAKYPAISRRFQDGALAEAMHSRRGPATLTAYDQRAAVTLVEDNLASLAKNQTQRIMALKAEIEAVTLQHLIAEYEVMLTKKLLESAWQRFFTDNPFILSIALATPYIRVQGQAYAGGARIDGSGGKYADFMLAAASTGNLALVEIKRSTTPLLGSALRNDVYPFSTDISGAIAQVLDQRRLVTQNIAVLKEESGRTDIHAFAIRCVVIAGSAPTEKHERKSFEMLRQSLHDVVLITYDELAIRLKEIAAALRDENQPDCGPPF